MTLDETLQAAFAAAFPGEDFSLVRVLPATDPKAIENGKRDLADLDGIVWEKDPYKAAKDADAVLLMTDWREYPELDWAKIYKSMRKPALVFDTRNCLDAAALKRLGFRVLNVGK